MQAKDQTIVSERQQKLDRQAHMLGRLHFHIQARRRAEISRPLPFLSDHKVALYLAFSRSQSTPL